MWCIWNEKMYGMVKIEIYGMQVGSGTRAQIDIYIKCEMVMYMILWSCRW